MIAKANVGAAMLNWRYVGKTFVNRDLVRGQILKEGPNSKPYRYIEKNDICRWLKAPPDADTDGRVVWLSNDGKFAKVSYVNRMLRKLPADSRVSEKSPTHMAILKKIPINQLTLLDINGNAAEKVEILYTKSGDPMRVTESGAAIPYQDENYEEKKTEKPSDTSERTILKYGKHIAEMQDVDESILESLETDLELELKESKIKTYWGKGKSWITKGASEK
jgi:hypothetical protein